MATDQAIAACGGNVRDAVKALIVANEFLEGQVAALQTAVSNGYSRGASLNPCRATARIGMIELESGHARNYLFHCVAVRRC
jgi:hypothetical protein